jgi:hypothetical protein
MITSKIDNTVKKIAIKIVLIASALVLCFLSFWVVRHYNIKRSNEYVYFEDKINSSKLITDRVYQNRYDWKETTSPYVPTTFCREPETKYRIIETKIKTDSKDIIIREHLTRFPVTTMIMFGCNYTPYVEKIELIYNDNVLVTCKNNDVELPVWSNAKLSYVYHKIDSSIYFEVSLVNCLGYNNFVDENNYNSQDLSTDLILYSNNDVEWREIVNYKQTFKEIISLELSTDKSIFKEIEPKDYEKFLSSMQSDLLFDDVEKLDNDKLDLLRLTIVDTNKLLVTMYSKESINNKYCVYSNIKKTQYNQVCEVQIVFENDSGQWKINRKESLALFKSI